MAAATETLMTTLIALETRRTEAWLQRRPDLLAALLDDDFIEINVLGRLDKRQLIEELFPKLKLAALVPRDYTLMAASDDVASLIYSCDESIEIGGQTISGRFTVASTWVRRAAGRRLLLWQITPLSA